MSVHLDSIGLTYVSAPKCASSSAKLFLFQVDHGRPFHRDAERRPIHRVYPTLPFSRLPHKRIADHTKIAVVRDPVDRLLSTYENKILDADILSSGLPRLLASIMGLPTRPDFATFLNRLQSYRRISPTLAKHTRPLSFHLGTDPAWFDHVFDVSEMHLLRKLIESRTSQTFELIGQKNKSSGTFDRTTVPDDAKALIRSLFAQDYALFGAFMVRHHDGAPPPASTQS